MYVGLTVAQTILLMLAGMNLYDALTHTFGTLATGGFSPRNASVAAFDSLAVEIIIVVFMVLAGTNFGLYFAMLHHDWRAPFKNTEWKVYILILVVASTLITANLMGAQVDAGLDPPPPAAPDYSLGEAARHATFLTVSLMTTTGFGTENFDTGPISRVCCS
jgi:trk system potassium uptake protein TrkH